MEINFYEDFQTVLDKHGGSSRVEYYVMDENDSAPERVTEYEQLMSEFTIKRCFSTLLRIVPVMTAMISLKYLPEGYIVKVVLEKKNKSRRIRVSFSAKHNDIDGNKWVEVAVSLMKTSIEAHEKSKEMAMNDLKISPILETNINNRVVMPSNGEDFSDYYITLSYQS